MILEPKEQVTDTVFDGQARHDNRTGQLVDIKTNEINQLQIVIK